ncbi:MAG: beta-aspartyl-peptidase [Candidatus Eisenbacteria bacterium]|uniref:Isoaspartyl dipeptidase n=1 Tax=Eiseniibacteriota bacterium TaxID=2212470 RepID=A0A956RSF4_UNCEI|nr:beta-aspartyl-peptidase [Candidatus Eisenbacteria bacterium]
MLQLLRNAHVFSPEPRGSCHLLISGELVAWMGQDVELPAELDAEEIDLEGRIVIPGLIDPHVHITGGGGESGEHTQIAPVPFEHFASSGITTVAGLLGTDDETRGTTSLIATARGLRNKGMSAYCYTGGYHIPPMTLTGTVRKDIVFIDPVIGVGEIAISDHRSSQPTLDEVLRVASEAYVGGMLANKAGVAHFHLGNGPRGLSLLRDAIRTSEIPPRVFYPTHVNRRKRLFEEAMDLATRGCYVDVTVYPNGSDQEGLSAEAAILLYLESGLPGERLTASSDAGGSLPRFDSEGNLIALDTGQPSALTRCLTSLLREGHSVRRVLPIFTLNPARALRLFKKGQITKGSDADLVVLDERFEVDSVMARGRWIHGPLAQGAKSSSALPVGGARS